MAKTIKFNLICDEKPVRTIEDLQNCFSIEDVLEYYNNKLLHRWLKVRGYMDELEKVSAITCEEPIDIIKELIKIFNVESDEKKVEKSVYILKYLKEREENCALYNKENYRVTNIINDYLQGYDDLLKDIRVHEDDVGIIKANINEIITIYFRLFSYNHRKLFYDYMKNKLFIMCLLMNENARKFYLPVEEEKKGKIILDTTHNSDKAWMFKEICGMINNSDFKTDLEDNIISFAGITDGYWKDLEPKGKKYMIIHMEKGDFVRPAGLSGGDLGSEDIINKFVILDGIDYKSNSDDHELLYMEV